MGLVIETTNDNYGHTVKGLRERKPGNYKHRLVKVTVIPGVKLGGPNLQANV